MNDSGKYTHRYSRENPYLGGSGFIGSHVVDQLLDRGYGVRVFDRSRERFRPTSARVEFVAGELSDTSSLVEALAGIDMVFHMISTAVPGTASMNPIADIQDNLIGSVLLLELMRMQEVTRLLYLSSGGTVYGIPKHNPVQETHSIAPISAYGIVRAAIENYIRMESELHGLRAIVLRPSNPYGPRQGHGGVQGVIGTYMHQLAHGETLKLWGDGSVVRDIIHVHDLARLCVACAEQDITGIFNAGDEEGHSLRQIIDGISEVSGRPVEPIVRPGRAIDIPRIVLDTRAACEAFGWQLQVAFKDGLRDTWKWVLQQLETAS